MEIMQNLQQLNDIEGDLAETAVAVAAEAPAPAAEGTNEAAFAPTNDATTNDPPPGSATASEPSIAVLQVAQGVEDVLEQNIPDAPVPQVSDAQLELPSTAELPSVTPTSAPASSERAQAQPQPIEQLIETVKKDDEPILPADIRPLAALNDDPATDVAAANADEIIIDDPSSSSATVAIAPAETAAPDQTLSGQTILQPTEEGYKPSPKPAEPSALVGATSGAPSIAVKVEEKEAVHPVEQQKLELPEGLTMASPSVSQNRNLAQEWSNGELVFTLRA